MMDAEVTGLYDRTKDAIVKIHAERAAQLAPSQFGPAHRVGSGFFLDDQGRIVTAGTLVEDAASISIDWQGRRIPARLIGRDPITNLAVLQIKNEPPTPYLTPGNSDNVRIGSMVIAIGFPYELPSAPVVGFVAGVDINSGQHFFSVSHIRAGCRLSPGQGGSPLLNSRGEVVGLVLAAHGVDQCYSLPMNAVKKLCADIVAHGAAQYPWVGLNVVDKFVTNSAQAQVVIRDVLTNTPAAQAGFQTNDILLRIATNEIHRTADVLNTMFYRCAGETLVMTVVRTAITQELSVVVGQRPSELEVSPPAVPLPVRAIPQVLPASEIR